MLLVLWILWMQRKLNNENKLEYWFDMYLMLLCLRITKDPLNRVVLVINLTNWFSPCILGD